MIFDLAILLLKIFGAILLIVMLRAIKINLRTSNTIKRLGEQGIESYPGNETFLVGSTLKNRSIYKELVKKGPVLPNFVTWQQNLLDCKDREGPHEPPLSAKKHPMVAYKLLQMVVTYVSDPQVVQDMYTT